jgi:glucose/arabinose dehydrogenase
VTQRRLWLLPLAALAFVWACAENAATPPPRARPTPGAACGASPPVAGTPELAAVLVATGFSRPLDLQAPAGDCRLFVVEQDGRIRVVRDGRHASPDPRSKRAMMTAAYTAAAAKYTRARRSTSRNPRTAPAMTKYMKTVFRKLSTTSSTLVPWTSAPGTDSTIHARSASRKRVGGVQRCDSRRSSRPSAR